MPRSSGRKARRNRTDERFWPNEDLPRDHPQNTRLAASGPGAGTSWALPESVHVLTQEEIEALVERQQRALARRAQTSRVERDFSLARRFFPAELVEDAIGDVLETVATGTVDPLVYRRLLLRWFWHLMRVTVIWLYMKYVRRARGG